MGDPIESWKQWHAELVNALGLECVERSSTLAAVKAQAERIAALKREKAEANQQVEAMSTELAAIRSPESISLGEALDVFLLALDGASDYRTWSAYNGDDRWALTLQRMAAGVLTPDKTIESLRTQLATLEREVERLRKAAEPCVRDILRKPNRDGRIAWGHKQDLVTALEGGEEKSDG